MRTLRRLEVSNQSFHLTKPLITHLACARSAPNDFAGEANEANVRRIVRQS